MAHNGIDPVRVDETEIELVQKFKYLSSIIRMKYTASEKNQSHNNGYSDKHYK